MQASEDAPKKYIGIYNHVPLGINYQASNPDSKTELQMVIKHRHHAPKIIGNRERIIDHRQTTWIWNLDLICRLQQLKYA